MKAPSSSGPEQAGQQVHEHLRLLEATAAANIDGVTISDARKPDYPLVYVNPGFERMTGYRAEEILGHNCRFLQGDDRDEAVLDEIREALQNEQPCRVTLRNYRKDGTLFWNELTIYPLRDEAGLLTHYVGIQRDVTERKKLEARFLQAQRMDSIGRLVGGIAHDLGNLLVPVLIGAKMLQQRFPEDEKAMRILKMIQQSGIRGAEMVKQVLAFARGVEGERVPLSPVGVFREVEKIVVQTFPRTITLEPQVPEDLWRIEGDSTQLQQILVNLCVNARDAMPEGGQLTIRAENITVDAAMARMILDARPGHFVRLSVTDTGIGMPSDVLVQVFEPFFTTKPVGTGTGLGLSTVYSIVKSHNGFATVYSEVGLGTTFHVYLPFSKADVPVETSQREVVVHQGKGKLVLVVDDEPFILEAASEALMEAGYTVRTAATGRQALEVFDAHAHETAAVVIDLMMPELDGLATIRALRARDPRLPIIAASGLGESKALVASEAGAPVFLAKPFTAAQLYEALEKALSSTADPAH